MRIHLKYKFYILRVSHFVDVKVKKNIYTVSKTMGPFTKLFIHFSWILPLILEELLHNIVTAAETDNPVSVDGEQFFKQIINGESKFCRTI